MKVFISSTYIDLIELRKITFKYFEQFAVDAQGMEIWGSSDDEPIEDA